MELHDLPLTEQTRNVSYYPNAKHPLEIDPTVVPEVYASETKGRCLEPVFSEGDCIVFSSNEPCLPGDFVGFWLHPDIPLPHELPRRIKRLKASLPQDLSLPYRSQFEGDLGPLIELEQLNPPRTLKVPASHILAMHKVIGTAETMTDGTATFSKMKNAQFDQSNHSGIVT